MNEPLREPLAAERDRKRRHTLSRCLDMPRCPGCGYCATYAGSAIVCLHCMRTHTPATAAKHRGSVIKVWESRAFVPRNREAAE